MKVWSALDGEPSIQLEVNEASAQPFVAAVAAKHRALVGRALWSDSLLPYECHHSPRLHEPSADDGWLPFGNPIHGPITTGEVQFLLAGLPVEEAERLEVAFEPNGGGDGYFGLFLEAGKVVQDAGAVLHTLVGYVGTAETLRLAGVFRALSRLHHGVPMEAVAAFRRTGVLGDELRWWLRQESFRHFEEMVTLTGLTAAETRSVLEAAGFHYVEPSGAHWRRTGEDDDLS